jgi:fimbrial isopeptide formation D2 family protein/uncharacterized repeat protein (TIGR02543 family)
MEKNRNHGVLRIRKTAKVTRRRVLQVLISLLLVVNSLSMYSSMLAAEPDGDVTQNGVVEPDSSEPDSPPPEASTPPEDGADPGGTDVQATGVDEPLEDAQVPDQTGTEVEEATTPGEEQTGTLPQPAGDDRGGGSQEQSEEPGIGTLDFEPVTVTYYIDGSEIDEKPTDVITGRAFNRPVFPAEYPERATLFLGWYTAPVGGTKFDFSQILSADISLYAHFEMSYLIKYKSAAGGVGDQYVIDTKVLNNGQPIPETELASQITPPVGFENGHILYWYVEGEDDTIPFDFMITQASKDLTLVPFWSYAHWVVFESEGTFVTPQIVNNGQRAVEPAAPTREGYTFAGWTLTPPNGATFNFTTAITADTTLYAKWTPLNVEYLALIWMERPNISGDPGTNQSNYQFAQAVPLTALAGSTVDFSTAAGANTYLSGVTLNTPYCEYRAGETKTVSGNGLTVVNVYYKRIVYTFTFDMAPGEASATTRPGTTLEFLGNTYHQGYAPNGTAYTESKYSFQAKFEQDVEAVWPSWANITSAYRTTSTYNGSIWEQTSSGEFSVWYCADLSFNLASKRFTINDELIPPAGTTERVMVAIYSPVSEYQVEYWLEALPGQEAGATPKTFGTTGERLYVKSDLHSQTIKISEGTLSPKGIEGTTNVGISNLDKEGREYDGSNTSLIGTYRFYYTRNTFKLDFNCQGGALPSGSLQPGWDYNKVMFEAPLHYYTPLNDPVWDNHSFLGWTYDSEGYMPVDFNTVIMPNADLTVFAQWLPHDFTIRYFDSRAANANLVETQPIGRGQVINLASAPYQHGQVVPGYGTFDTWYVRVGNVWAKWPADRTVNENVDLYAGWITDGFQITYELGAGSGSKPVDNDFYWAGMTSRLSYGEGVIPPAGQVLIGWTAWYNGISPADAAVVHQTGNYYSVYGNTTMTAVFAQEPNAVHIIYHSNYPDGTTEVTRSIWTVPDNTGHITLLDDIFNRPTALMTGWNTAANGSGIQYDLSAYIVAPPVGAALHLYGSWVAKTTYVVHYYETGSTDRVAPDKTVTNQVSGASVTETAIAVDGYTAVAPVSVTIVLATSGNEIIFYYSPRSNIRVIFSANTSDPVTGPTPTEKFVTFNRPYGALATIYRTNYAFIGWFTSPTGGTEVTSTTIVTDFNDHYLYAHWRPVPILENFAKAANTDRYYPGLAGQTLSYTVTFKLPADVSDYQTLRVADVYPASALSFTGASVKVGSGTAQALTPDGHTAPGLASFSFNAATLATMANQTVVVTLNFNVSTSATGTIHNTANYYITPAQGVEPSTPTGSDDADVYAADLTVTYDGNGATGGTPPVDPSSPYVSGDSVSVIANAGTLIKADYTFVGWAYNQNATSPDFLVSGGTVTPPTFTINGSTVLYAVWKNVGDTGDFTKTTNQTGYIAGQTDSTLTYKISYTLPDSFDTWQSLRIADSYPSAKISYAGNATVTFGSGAAQPLTPDGRTTIGTLSFSFPKALLLGHENETMVITVTFNVAPTATGTISNRALYYITPASGGEPEDPPGDDEDVYELIPIEDFAKNYDSPFLGVGSDINFNVSFTLPDDIRGYEGLLIVDELPSTLNLKGVTVLINDTASTYAPSVTGNKISLYFSKTDLAAIAANSTVDIQISTTVNSTWVSGNITNTAWLYYQTDKLVVPDPDTDDPDDEATTEVPNRNLTVTYNGNGATGGTPPVDSSSPYALGQTVAVIANAGTLYKTDNTFLGWAYSPTATTPDFLVSGGPTTTPPTFTINGSTVLYAVWSDVGDTGDFTKTTNQTGYIAGQTDSTLTYTISYTLPDSFDNWQSLRIVDNYPSAKISFAGNATVTFGSGAAQTLTPDGRTTPNSLSFSFPKALLLGHENETMVITVTFNVAPTATGTISNRAFYIITPASGGEPEDPPGDDEEVYELVPIEDFTKSTTSTFSGRGANVSFNVSFTLPSDIRGYEGLLIVDRLPSTLNFNSVSVRINDSASSYTPIVSGGVVSLYLTKANLNAIGGGSRVVIQVTATVNDNWNTGNIVNNAYLFYQTDPGQTRDPNDPPDDQATVEVPYVPIRYTMTYNANGGSNAPVDPNSPYVAGSTVTVRGQSGMYRNNYTFLGWSTYAGGGVAYYSGATFTINANTTLFAVWRYNVTPPQPTTYTVIYQPGTHGTFAQQSTSGLSYGATTPAAPTPTGDAGWNFTGWSPAIQATVTGNVTYVAQWEAAPVEPPITHTVIFVDWDDKVLSEQTVIDGGSAIPPANPTRQGYTFTGWDQDYTRVTRDMVIHAVYAQVQIVPDPPTPEAGSWALINLILTILGTLASLGMIIAYFFNRKEDEEDEDGEDRVRTKRLWIRIINVIFAIVAIIIFILTEDIRLPMVLFDWWTILHIIIFIIQAVLLFLSTRRKEEDEDTQRPYGDVPAN